MHTRYDTEKEEKRVNERETRGARKASLIKIDRSSKWLMFDIVNRYIKSILKKCLSYLSFSLSLIFSFTHSEYIWNACVQFWRYLIDVQHDKKNGIFKLENEIEIEIEIESLLINLSNWEFIYYILFCFRRCRVAATWTELFCVMFVVVCPFFYLYG